VDAAGASAPIASEDGYPSLYRPGNVRATAAYQLVEAYYERFKTSRFRKAQVRSMRFGTIAYLELQTKRDLSVM
jgi:hypothetical protein